MSHGSEEARRSFYYGCARLIATQSKTGSIRLKLALEYVAHLCAADCPFNRTSLERSCFSTTLWLW